MFVVKLGLYTPPEVFVSFSLLYFIDIEHEIVQIVCLFSLVHFKNTYQCLFDAALKHRVAKSQSSKYIGPVGVTEGNLKTIDLCVILQRVLLKGGTEYLPLQRL